MPKSALSLLINEKGKSIYKKWFSRKKIGKLEIGKLETACLLFSNFHGNGVHVHKKQSCKKTCGNFYTGV